MNVSVLIPVYNKALVISRVIGAVLTQLNSEDEVVALDDGSSDNSFNELNQYPIKVLQRQHETVAFRLASARNFLVEHASKDYLIFLSGDCVPHANFIALHKEAAQTVRSKTLVRGVVYENGNPIIGPIDGYSQEWEKFITGNLGLKKKDFYAIGGFDENFDGEWGGEDTEFGYRALKVHGYNIFGIDAAVDHMPHKNEAKDRYMRKHINNLKIRNQAYFREKHGLE